MCDLVCPVGHPVTHIFSVSTLQPCGFVHEPLFPLRVSFSAIFASQINVSRPCVLQHVDHSGNVIRFSCYSRRQTILVTRGLSTLPPLFSLLSTFPPLSFNFSCHRWFFRHSSILFYGRSFGATCSLPQTTPSTNSLLISYPPLSTLSTLFPPFRQGLFRRRLLSSPSFRYGLLLLTPTFL